MRPFLTLLGHGTLGRFYLSNRLILRLVFAYFTVLTFSWGMAKKNSTSVKVATKSTPAIDVLRPVVAAEFLDV
jgi:hypothetical protein